ncbi:MAG: oxidoreductase, partial [Spirochaetes bacterium]|nr:oxidoreductase [Spirochaetota bacterium]
MAAERSSSTRPIDIALLGATGFAGGLVARHLARRCRDDGLRLALAGRNREGLARIAAELGSELGDANWQAATRVADVTAPDSLHALAADSFVLCSTVGPYAMYGAPVVAACVAEGADYLDLTGEVHWMREMIDAYDQAARNAGVRIVHACGFDSVPSDLGV